MAQRIRDEATDNWDDRVAVERFESKGGRFVRGSGRIVGPGRVAVGDNEIEARLAIVVANGSKPSIPQIRGLSRVMINHPAWVTVGIQIGSFVRGVVIGHGGRACL